MRLFQLERSEDPTGVSGTGIVAEGIEYSDGVVALRWCVGDHRSTVIWAGLEAVRAIHYDGKTRIIFLNPRGRTFAAGEDPAPSVTGALAGQSSLVARHQFDPDFQSLRQSLATAIEQLDLKTAEVKRIRAAVIAVSPFRKRIASDEWMELANSVGLGSEDAAFAQRSLSDLDADVQAFSEPLAMTLEHTADDVDGGRWLAAFPNVDPDGLALALGQWIGHLCEGNQVYMCRECCAALLMVYRPDLAERYMERVQDRITEHLRRLAIEKNGAQEVGGVPAGYFEASDGPTHTYVPYDSPEGKAILEKVRGATFEPTEHSAPDIHFDGDRPDRMHAAGSTLVAPGVLRGFELPADGVVRSFQLQPGSLRGPSHQSTCSAGGVGDPLACACNTRETVIRDNPAPPVGPLRKLARGIFGTTTEPKP